MENEQLRTIETDPLELTQEHVWRWCEATFAGITEWDGHRERAFRFLEEALELFQSLGMSEQNARDVVAYAFDRPAGIPAQEIGGVMVTLLALGSQQNLSIAACLGAEFRRVQNPEVQARIRDKQAAKARAGSLLAVPAEKR